MSYASVAAANAPPLHQQPHPDTALLNTDDTRKANVQSQPPFDDDDDGDDDAELPTPHRKSTRNKKLQEVEAEGLYLWATTKHYLLRPGIAGGLLGLVNVGLLAGAGYTFYSYPNLRRDRRALSSTIAAVVGLFSAEGFLAERSTPKEDEPQRPRKRKQLLSPAMRDLVRSGKLFRFVNSAVLGTVAYLAYIHWDRPTWDRRVVSSMTASLGLLWMGEAALENMHNLDDRH